MVPFVVMVTAMAVPGAAEFGGVVQQIVAHLGDGVRIAPNLHRVVGEMGIHVQLTVVDLALQC